MKKIITKSGVYISQKGHCGNCDLHKTTECVRDICGNEDIFKKVSIPNMAKPIVITEQDKRDAEKLFCDIKIPSEITEKTANALSDSLERVGRSAAMDFRVSQEYLQNLISGIWKVNVKSKTRYVTFQFEGREITLAGKNAGNKIEVGYSVYCDHIKDKRKNPTPKDPELSKKIALGRLEKSPIYSLNVSDEPHRFIDTALDVARTKILKGELIIKGIR